MRWEITLVGLLCLVGTMAAQSCSSKSNGCSVPFGLNYFFKKRFTPACDKHDVCYSCGSARGVDKGRCDSSFWTDLKAICSSYRGSDNAAETTWCNMVTFDYYFAVRVGGRDHFVNNSPSWCRQSWVSSCLP